MRCAGETRRFVEPSGDGGAVVVMRGRGGWILKGLREATHVLQAYPDPLEGRINACSVLSGHPENVLDDCLVNVKSCLHETIHHRTNLFESSDVLRNEEDAERSDDRNVETLGTAARSPVVDDHRPTVMAKPVGQDVVLAPAEIPGCNL